MSVPCVTAVLSSLDGSAGSDDHVRAEPIVEIVTEAADPSLRCEVAVGRGGHLASKSRTLGVANALNLSRLRVAQQLHLNGRVQLSDLVQTTLARNVGPSLTRTGASG